MLNQMRLKGRFVKPLVLEKKRKFLELMSRIRERSRVETKVEADIDNVKIENGVPLTSISSKLDGKLYHFFFFFLEYSYNSCGAFSRFLLTF